jgi:hypothetical protein
MSFTGYCTTAELARSLDYGNWRDYVGTYSSADGFYLPCVSDDNNLNYIIDGTTTIYVNDVLIDTEDYTINLDTGEVTFDLTPAIEDGDSVKAIYYITRGFSNETLQKYVTLAARRVEKDSCGLYREVEAEYTTDGNEGYDYINYVNNTTIQLPWPVLSVESLDVDGVTIDVTTLKISGSTISLTKDSGVNYFSGKANTTEIEVTHGIPDDEADRTEDQQSMYELAKEANITMATMLLLDSPIGRNTSLDNSYIVQRSDGSVRPDLTVESELTRYEKKYLELIQLLQHTTTKLI